MKKTALITGGSSGIGRCIAEVYAQDGSNLLLVAQDMDMLKTARETLEASYDISVDILSVKLEEEKAAEKIIKYTKDNDYSVETLVNCAGTGELKKFTDADISLHLEAIYVNIKALKELTWYYLKEMEKEGSGEILNVSSMTAYISGPFQAVYHGTKAYVKSFTEGLAVEMKNSPIKIMALCPSVVASGFEERTHAEKSGLYRMLTNDLPEQVAEFAVTALKRGKTIAIPGLRNKFLAVLTKLVPEVLLRETMYFILKPRESNLNIPHRINRKLHNGIII